MLMPNSEIVCNMPGYCKFANYVVCNYKKATKAWLFGTEILVLKISMILKFRDGFAYVPSFRFHRNWINLTRSVLLISSGWVLLFYFRNFELYFLLLSAVQFMYCYSLYILQDLMMKGKRWILNYYILSFMCILYTCSFYVRI